MNNIRRLFVTNERYFIAFCFLQRRFRYKQKWASSKKKQMPTDLAQNHFDIYYKPVFGSRWPSIRIALLSRKKYCAVINNFTSDQDDVALGLAELGASDFVRTASNTETNGRFSLLRSADEKSHKKKLKDDDVGGGRDDVADNRIVSDSSGTESIRSANVYDFMPVKKIVSEKEQMMIQDMEQNVRGHSSNFAVDILPHKHVQFPRSLRAFTPSRGDITSFPPAGRAENGKLTYYLMDAGSVLPIIALDLEPGCRVLDLCAAPGGKSFAILQTMLPESVTCVDHSYGRIQRLRDVVRYYFPSSYFDEGRVEIVHANGVAFCGKSAGDLPYDRVLVDVPCYADRHVLSEDDNNIFRPSRLPERLQIQDLQQQLLFAGIKSCRPGGVVVYSTCTLSMPQNDGVIQATLEKIWQETSIDVAVENTGIIADHFRTSFDFYGKCRYGQLVLPNLVANFGPTYFCKLRRLK